MALLKVKSTDRFSHGAAAGSNTSAAKQAKY
jgi:hypothetical protein